MIRGFWAAGRYFLRILAFGLILSACFQLQGTVGAGTTASSGSDTLTPGAAPDFGSYKGEGVSLLKAIRSPVFMKAVLKFFDRLVPNQGGVIWLFIIIALLVAFDFRRLISWRNADILLLMLLCFLLIDLISLSGGWTPASDPAQKSLFGIMFLGIFLVSIILLIRALIGAFTRRERAWIPNLPKKALVILTVILFTCNALIALVRFPDDCGAYTNMGAKRMLETGKFPYGDRTLRGGAAATYGPILYLAHIPFLLPLSHIESNGNLDEYSLSNWVVTGSKRWDVGRPILATKLALLLFHLIGVVGLVMIGRRLHRPEVGWGLACLYIGSAYVQGLGGEEFFITGMTYISHIAPAAITIMAFVALNRPFWSGSLLGIATGVLFYPAFFFPLWLGFYFWQGKQWKRFAAGFIIVCLAIGIMVLFMTQSSENESVFQVVYESTVGHQEAKEAYGSSTFGFWGTHPQLAAFWQKPFIQGWYWFKPSFLVFAVFMIATFFMSRGRTVAQFAFLTAAVAIAAQLWKSHAGGTYIEWYYPFFLIGFLGQQVSSASDQPIQKPSNTHFVAEDS